MDAGFREALGRGVGMFNRGEFFEAHEVWEDAWRGRSGEPATFLQGLIQAAAGFVKVQRNMPRGAAALFGSAAGKLAPFSPERYGVAIAPLLEAVGRWREAVAARIGKEGALDIGLPLPGLIFEADRLDGRTPDGIDTDRGAGV